MEAIEIKVKSEIDIEETDINVNEMSDDNFVVIPTKEENDEEIKLEPVDPLSLEEFDQSGNMKINLQS